MTQLAAMPAEVKVRKAGKPGVRQGLLAFLHLAPGMSGFLIFMVIRSLFRFGLFAARTSLLDVLPVRRRTVVVSHYMVILAAALAVGLLGTVLFLMLQGLGVAVPTDWAMRWIASLGAVLLIIGLVLPHRWRSWRSWRTAVVHLPVLGVVAATIILTAAHTTGNLY